MKKLIVFGSTGTTGLTVLARTCRDPEFKVTAYLRNPEKVPKDIRNRITIILGNVFNEDAVADALEDQDAVISCLGVGANLTPTTVISQGAQNVINGMRKHGVKKIVLVGTGFLLPNHPIPYLLKVLGAHHSINDHKRAYEILKKSTDIEWVCTATPFIIGHSYTETCKTAINKPTGRVVASHDLADWMISCIKDEQMAKEYTHQLVGLSSSAYSMTWLSRRTKVILTLSVSGLILVGLYAFGVF